MKREKLTFDAQVESILKRLGEGRPVRSRLPGGVRFQMDRPLPFLCVYRRPEGHTDRGTLRLVTTEAAFVLATGGVESAHLLERLVEAVAQAMARRFGSFLLLELWAGPVAPDGRRGQELPAPSFRVFADPDQGLQETVDLLAGYLEGVRVKRRDAQVQRTVGRLRAPPGYKALLGGGRASRCACWRVGIEVAAIYRDERGETVYPLVLRGLRQGIARALMRALDHFVRHFAVRPPASLQARDRALVNRTAARVDHELADIAESFDFLLQVTPVNMERAWRHFHRHPDSPPAMRYRPLPMDPTLMKRRLFRIPVERVEDPTLERLFREKQLELDRQLTMLMDIGTHRFLHGSIALYGPLSPRVLQVARRILETLPPHSREDPEGRWLTAEEMAVLARDEITRYRGRFPAFRSAVQVRSDIYSGLMVSHGQLLIGREAKFPRARATALLAHEVGTHVLTYNNGKAQPFRQLAVGLAGYEELQEGLAVLGEYLVGGLNVARLRLLAARVVAADSLADGADFVETWRLLHDTWGFAAATAFTITTRIFRGGGLTKDAVYLRGVLRVLDYLREGGALEPLYVGKIAARHVPLIREMEWRGVLGPVPLRPRFLEDDDSRARLKEIRTVESLYDLIQRPGKRKQRKKG